MRTIVRLFTWTLFMTLSAATVSAQMAGPIKLYAGGGFSKQHRPGLFKDDYKTGYHVTAGVGYKLLPMIEATGEFRYNSFATNLTVAGLGDVTGGKIKATMFGVAVRFAPEVWSVPFAPYALGGGGFAMMNRDDFVYPPETKVGTADIWNAVFRLDDQTRFYYSVGGGVRYKLIPKVSLFAEARYTNILTKQDNSIFDKPIRFWEVTGGVRLL